MVYYKLVIYPSCVRTTASLTDCPSVGQNSLKALIKAIRATKTIADERALIVKESAVIRTSFKEEG
jgi:DUF1009 family protein